MQKKARLPIMRHLDCCLVRWAADPFCKLPDACPFWLATEVFRLDTREASGMRAARGTNDDMISLSYVVGHRTPSSALKCLANIGAAGAVDREFFIYLTILRTPFRIVHSCRTRSLPAWRAGQKILSSNMCRVMTLFMFLSFSVFLWNHFFGSISTNPRQLDFLRLSAGTA